MEQKIKYLKASSKAISIIAKIFYTVMIVAISICAVTLIFIAATGGETFSFKIGGTNVIIFDSISATPTQILSICSILIVLCGFFLAIFLFTYRMFHEISLTGDPFTPKHVMSVRVIGILTAVMPIAVGIVESIVTVCTKAEIPSIYPEIPGIVVGAVIFCLSYIIDYGCGLKNQSKSDN